MLDIDNILTSNTIDIPECDDDIHSILANACVAAVAATQYFTVVKTDEAQKQTPDVRWPMSIISPVGEELIAAASRSKETQFTLSVMYAIRGEPTGPGARRAIRQRAFLREVLRKELAAMRPQNPTYAELAGRLPGWYQTDVLRGEIREPAPLEQDSYLAYAGQLTVGFIVTLEE